MKAWRYFQTYLEVRKFAYPGEPLILNVKLLKDYGVWRFRRSGVKGSTIRNDITGINCILEYYDLSIRLGRGHSNILQKLYRACDRVCAKYDIGNKTFHRRALTDAILYPMLDAISGDTYSERIARGVLLTGKKGALRAHNYVWTDGGGLARLENVHFTPQIDDPQSMFIEFPLAKTKQIDAPTRECRTLHCECATSRWCVVHEVAAICKGRTNKKEALFLNENGFPFTYTQLMQLLKGLCEIVEIDPRYYPSHALRIGEATDQNMRGVSVEVTMKFVGWRSRKSALIYIRPCNPDFVKFDSNLGPLE